MIRIGNQTHCHTPARVPYEFALRHGFDAFEWFSDKGQSGWCEEDMGPAERAGLRGASRDHGIAFSVHVPHTANPAHPDGAAQILRSIRFARDIGAALVNLHLFPEVGPRRFVASLLALTNAARQAGVRLSLENTPHTSPADFNAVFDLLQRIPDARRQIGMCFDMGHANLFAGTHNDYVRFVDSLGEHVPILHWHAHENWGDGDSHLPLFTGPARRDEAGVRALAARLLRRGFDGSIVLEQWPAPPELLIEVRDRLRAVLRSAM